MRVAPPRLRWALPPYGALRSAQHCLRSAKPSEPLPPEQKQPITQTIPLRPLQTN